MDTAINAISTALASTIKPVATLIKEPRRLYSRLNKVRPWKGEVIQGYRESKKLYDFYDMLYPNHRGETNLSVMERDGIPDFVLHEAHAIGTDCVFRLHCAMRQTLINSGTLWECISGHFARGDVVSEWISDSMDRASDTDWADALLLAFSGGNYDDLKKEVEDSQFEVDKFERIAEGAQIRGRITPGEGKPSLLRAFKDRKKHTVSICEYPSDEDIAVRPAPSTAVISIGYLIVCNSGTMCAAASRVALSAMRTCERISLERLDTRILVETVVKMTTSSQFLSFRGKIYSEETISKEEMGIDHEMKNILNFPKLAQVVRNMELVLDETTHAKPQKSTGRATATFAELRELQLGRRKEDLGLMSVCSSTIFATLVNKVKNVSLDCKDHSPGKEISILTNAGWEEAKPVISQILKKIGDRASTTFKKNRKTRTQMREVQSLNQGLLWFDRIFAGGTLTQKRRDELQSIILRKDEPTHARGKEEELYYFPLVDTVFAITNKEEAKHYRARTVQLASYGGKESHPGVLAAIVTWFGNDKDDDNGQLVDVVMKRGQQGYDKLLDILDPELATAIYGDVDQAMTLRVSNLIQICSRLPEGFDKDWVIREVLSVCTILGISYTVSSANLACYSKVIEHWQDVNSATKRVVEYDYPVPVNGAIIHAKKKAASGEVVHVLGAMSSRRVGTQIVVTCSDSIESVLRMSGRDSRSEKSARFEQQSGRKILHLEVMTLPREYQGFGTDKVVWGSYGAQGNLFFKRHHWQMPTICTQRVVGTIGERRVGKVLY